MVPPAYMVALRQLFMGLQEHQVTWVVTGSLSFALQGLPLEPHDIDIQTDTEGAYEIERHFSSQVIQKVSFSSSDRIRSHFGALQIEGIVVEIMGDIQKRLDENGLWEPSVDLKRHRQFVHVDGMEIPVLALSYEAQAYRTLGRWERARMLQEASLHQQNPRRQDFAAQRGGS